MLDHVNERRVRRGLPADVLIGFVELDPPACSKGDEIRFIHEFERWMLLEKVREVDPKVDEIRFNDALRAQTSGAGASSC